MSRDFVGALLQLNAEKQVSREQLIGAVEDGIQSAYRRVAGDEDIHVKIDEETGKIRVYRARYAVEEVEDPLVEFSLEEARAVKPDAQPGELVETEELKDDVFGRIGAQTAKQIVLQRIREVERDRVFDQFASREGEMITGTIQRFEGGAVTVNLGKTDALLPRSEQIPGESHHPGERVRAIILDVRKVGQRVKIILSRTHPDFVRRLFDGEKNASNLTMIRLAIALVTDPELARKHPDRVPFVLDALTDAQLSDAIAEFPESRARTRWAS